MSSYMEHSQRWQQHRTPSDKRAPVRHRPPVERVLSNTDFSGPCWEFLGKKSGRGYGVLQVSGVLRPAHRVVWEWLIGPISDDLVLDHLCRVRSCVNPDHLEPVTQQENVRRGYAPAALNARKTHCAHGHEFTPENTRMSHGRRRCVSCERLRTIRRRKEAA